MPATVAAGVAAAPSRAAAAAADAIAGDGSAAAVSAAAVSAAPAAAALLPGPLCSELLASGLEPSNVLAAAPPAAVLLSSGKVATVSMTVRMRSGQPATAARCKALLPPRRSTAKGSAPCCSRTRAASV